MKTSKLFVLLLSMNGCLFAQNFKWQTPIDSVPEKGFYSVFLSPEITCHLNSNYSDIRIFDEKNTEIPYLFEHYYGNDTKAGQLTEIKGIKISQSDSTEVKQTYVRITFDTPQYIDKLKFRIKGPTYYLRNAQIALLQKEDDKRRWGNKETDYQPVHYFELNSSLDSAVVQLPRFKAAEFYLIIDNEDNQPLEIEVVQAFQLKSSIVSLLEQGKKYILKFGDETLAAADYDLVYFQNNIPESVPTIATGEIIQLLKDEENPPKPGFLSNKAILWTVLGIVVFLLGLLSVKMVRDMKEKNNEHGA